MVLTATAVIVSRVSMETTVRLISTTVPVMTCVRMEEHVWYGALIVQYFNYANDNTLTLILG